PLASARRSAVAWITWTPAERAPRHRRATAAIIGVAAAASSGRAEVGPTTPFWISDVTMAVWAGSTSSARLGAAIAGAYLTLRQGCVAGPEGSDTAGVQGLPEGG